MTSSPGSWPRPAPGPSRLPAALPPARRLASRRAGAPWRTSRIPGWCGRTLAMEQGTSGRGVRRTGAFPRPFQIRNVPDKDAAPQAADLSGQTDRPGLLPQAGDFEPAATPARHLSLRRPLRAAISYRPGRRVRRYRSDSAAGYPHSAVNHPCIFMRRHPGPIAHAPAAGRVEPPQVRQDLGYPAAGLPGQSAVMRGAWSCWISALQVQIWALRALSVSRRLSAELTVPSRHRRDGCPTTARRPPSPSRPHRGARARARHRGAP